MQYNSTIAYIAHAHLHTICESESQELQLASYLLIVLNSFFTISTLATYSGNN